GSEPNRTDPNACTILSGQQFAETVRHDATGIKVSINLGAGNDYFLKCGGYTDIHGEGDDDDLIVDAVGAEGVLLDGAFQAGADAYTVVGTAGNDAIEQTASSL